MDIGLIHDDGSDSTNNATSANNTSISSVDFDSSLQRHSPGELLIKGDMQCPSQLMCVTGVVDGSFVNYELQSTGVLHVGWMAVGFGTQMSDTPMVIMWPNDDGTITLSQRETSASVMPTPVANPPHIATPRPDLSVLSGSGSQTKLVFTIPGNETVTNLTWAYGVVRPDKPSDSIMYQHVDANHFSLDLSQNLSSATKTLPHHGPLPFLPYEKLIIAHAVFVSLGFLILLPTGVLIARIARTYSNKWFMGHWILQWALAGPSIAIGGILGYLAVQKQGTEGYHSTHKTLGSLLFALYFVQCTLGAFIHFVKIKFPRLRKPPQNYIHAILGLTLIGLSFYQARLGFTREWLNSTGRPRPNAIEIVWSVLLAAVGAAYIIGLGLLPRQYRQEKDDIHRSPIAKKETIPTMLPSSEMDDPVMVPTTGCTLPIHQEVNSSTGLVDNLIIYFGVSPLESEYTVTKSSSRSLYW